MLKLLKKMNDPETGMMSGFIKLGDKIFEKAKIERDKQIKELDNKIDEIISQSNSENFQKIKLKLLSVKWTPISHSTIDEDMTEHYEKLVEKLIHQLENNN